MQVLKSRLSRRMGLFYIKTFSKSRVCATAFALAYDIDWTRKADKIKIFM